MVDISYQLYCSRNFPPLADTCKMLAAAGYTQVEGFGGLFDDLDALKAAVDDAGLAMTSSHINLAMVREDPAQAIKIAQTMGFKKAFVPFVMPDDRPTDDAGWRAFGQQLVEMGKPLQDAGIMFGWHNHDFELVALPSGARPLELMAQAGLTLELDLGWVARAGEDPAKWVAKYADQIAAVHVKDIATAGDCTDEDGWADVGHGTLDWASIHAACAAAGVSHYVVEHDNPNDHTRFAQRSIAAINNF